MTMLSFLKKLFAPKERKVLVPNQPLSEFKEEKKEEDDWIIKKIFSISLVGVTFRNDDGSSRQEILSYTIDGSDVELRREPDNPYDKWAIAVFNEDNEQMGYLPSSDDLARFMDKGNRIRAFVEEVTGIPEFGEKHGCRLKLTLLEKKND